MSLSLSGGLGAILSTFFGLYMPQGHTAEQIVYLLTFPSLFIGIGMNSKLHSRRTPLMQWQETFSYFPSRFGLVEDRLSWLRTLFSLSQPFLPRLTMDMKATWPLGSFRELQLALPNL